jgi:2-methylisocitrate lyase-like PEP mutase family enzyme
MNHLFKFRQVSSSPLLGCAAGEVFRERIRSGKILPLCGIFDAFSALVAAKRFEGVFCSGFGFAASQYGLPDIGYVNWRDMHDFASRIRHVLPNTHLLVDVDDGFGEEVISANTISQLEATGVSAVMIEDQKRPRRCGHFEGKQVLPSGQFSLKLKSVLAARRSLFVIARTDATDTEDGLRRAIKYVEDGADGVMVEAVHDLEFVSKVVKQTQAPVMVNQLHGGKSPNWTLQEMQEIGVSVVIYSTPCLFAAQYGMEKYLDQLIEKGVLPDDNTSDMHDCVKILHSPPNYCIPPGTIASGGDHKRQAR